MVIRTLPTVDLNLEAKASTAPIRKIPRKPSDDRMLYICWWRIEQFRTKMQTSSVKIAAKIMVAMGIYALVVSIFWTFLTEVMFVSDFGAYTGQSLSDALSGGSKSAELWLIGKRLIGVELIPLSILMIFIAHKSYSKGEKWAWYALLVAGIMMWGSLIGYKLAIGYFQPTPSSMTFIIGAILFLIGIILPAKAILSTKDR